MSLHSQLRLGNLCWRGDEFSPAFAPDSVASGLKELAGLSGQFAWVSETRDGTLYLVRDRLGVNKLFFALHEAGTVHVANRLQDLRRCGVPLEAVFSVPAGHLQEVNPAARRLVLHRYYQARDTATGPERPLEEVARSIRAGLESWFSRFARQFGSRRICVCLSGGLDSSVVAALARKHFSDVIAYTYTFVGEEVAESDDLRHARQLAEYLGIELREVPAGADQILAAIDPALVDGQDWRDFNVHCAIVNHTLGQAVAEDARSWEKPLLLLTGDLMNEYMADYTPVHYGGREYYTLPRLRMAELRLALVRGLDSGDREIGVFGAHGLEVLQPYSFLLDAYLRVPARLLGEEDSKQNLVKAVAGDLLPSFILERRKVRAQIGNAQRMSGILPLLVDSGRDSAWLRRRFCELFHVSDEGFLSRFLAMGMYRFLGEFPRRVLKPSGFYG
jgi:asparagine synthetase B (glutamine-hydrolysing)